MMVLAPAPIALALLALCTSTIPSYIFSSSYIAFCWDNARAQRSHIALCCRPVSASLHGSCCLCRASDKLLPPPSRAAGASWLRSAYRSLSSHISHRSRPRAPSTTLLPPSLLLLPRIRRRRLHRLRAEPSACHRCPTNTDCVHLPHQQGQ